MGKLLLLVPFLLFCLSSFTQTNIQQDNRASTVLKRAVSPQSGYNTYGRTGRFINMAVLNPSSRTISWFTCHGWFFDSTSLDDQEFKLLTTKQLNPFELYQHICDKYLADLAAAKDLYRTYGDKQLFDRLGGNYQALFAMESVQAAKTPLQKLVAIENVRKKILIQLAWLNCANPASLQNDPLYRGNKEQAGVMVQTKDSTIYYNIDPTSAVAKICLYKRSPEKLYVQNRQSEIIDSISIQSEKYELLQKEKTDVFLLYRGWLEMQWQDAMGTGRINPAEYQQVNISQASYRQLNAIRAKINLLISPDEKCIQQTVYETYRSETSEMYYIPLLGISYNLVQTRGLKEYELGNHLDNVLVTISDRKNGVPSPANPSLIDHYEPDIVSAQDYYPFGMLQPGRSLSTGEKYRYGFNGKENDNEVKGEGNQQDYGMRVYDPRLGKFLSVDPLTKEYPWYTPYQFSGNTPIQAVDLDGMEEWVVTRWYDKNNNVTKIRIFTVVDKKNPTTHINLHFKNKAGDELAKGNKVLYLNLADGTNKIFSPPTTGSSLTKKEEDLFNTMKQKDKFTFDPHWDLDPGYSGYSTKSYEEAAKNYTEYNAYQQFRVIPPITSNPTASFSKFEWDEKGNEDTKRNRDLYQEIANWLRSNPDYKLDVGITGMDSETKRQGRVLKNWNETLVWHPFAANETFGNRTDNVIKQIRDNVQKLGGDVSRLNLHRGDLNSGSNNVKVEKVTNTP